LFKHHALQKDWQSLQFQGSTSIELVGQQCNDNSNKQPCPRRGSRKLCAPGPWPGFKFFWENTF